MGCTLLVWSYVRESVTPMHEQELSNGSHTMRAGLSPVTSWSVYGCSCSRHDLKWDGMLLGCIHLQQALHGVLCDSLPEIKQ